LVSLENLEIPPSTIGALTQAALDSLALHCAALSTLIDAALSIARRFPLFDYGRFVRQFENCVISCMVSLRLCSSIWRILLDLPSSQSAFFAPSELRSGLHFLGQPYQRWLRMHFRILTASTVRSHFTPNLSRKARDDCSLVSIRNRLTFASDPLKSGRFAATYPMPRFGNFWIRFFSP
jgi:hypothetical protein